MPTNPDLWCEDPVTVCSVEQVADHLDDPEYLFLDTRFELANPSAGRERYLAGHLPGARYVDLERDLSGPVRPGTGGRHPLPADESLVALFTRLGITGDRKVIAYDDNCGAMAAARLWWLLRYAGHRRVAVLDGGITRWRERGLRVETGEATPTAETSGFVASFQRDLVVTAGDVVANNYQVLVDSRATERYRGDVEPLDPVGGHIPGAICLPFSENLTQEGTLRPAEELAERFAALPHPADTTSIVFYCGSGVTAAQNLLAFARARGQLAAMYPGSWSEWVADPNRPVATGG
jgi:thiosulfate/3-mercaptopyruvate sulfurtransferase